MWHAFAVLSTDRPSGWSLGPIPWSAIDRYARRHGIDGPDHFAWFETLIMAMDREFMAWHAARAEREKGK